RYAGRGDDLFGIAGAVRLPDLQSQRHRTDAAPYGLASVGYRFGHSKTFPFSAIRWFDDGRRVNHHHGHLYLPGDTDAAKRSAGGDYHVGGFTTDNQAARHPVGLDRRS